MHSFAAGLKNLRESFYVCGREKNLERLSLTDCFQRESEALRANAVALGPPLEGRRHVLPQQDATVLHVPECAVVDLLFVIGADGSFVSLVEVLTAGNNGGAGALAAQYIASSHACDVTEGPAVHMAAGP
jgi:hypothetical protein